MAFGTGTHPTTKLSMQALELVIHGGESMIDVGTGSGVLSITAKQLGAGDIRAYDLDQVAVDSAKKNLALNQLRISPLLPTTYQRGFRVKPVSLLLTFLPDNSSLIPRPGVCRYDYFIVRNHYGKT